MSTARTERAQPRRVFSEYSLSRITSPDIGLTEIPWGKMQRVIGANINDDTALFDLGQRFDFDGRSFDRALVSSNGYMVLGATSTLAFVGGAGSNNTLITGTVTTSGAVMFAPWFNDLRTALVTDTPYGGVWTTREHGPHGVRSVTRWVCRYLNSVAATSNVLTFECVLNSNGAIEFRYAPFAVVTPPSGETGAVIGVFTTGTNSFRDFSRDNVVLGGATYTPTFSDAGNVYGHSLTVMRGWPGGTRMGSHINFKPRQLTRRNSPRIDVRAQGAIEVQSPSGFNAIVRRSHGSYDDRRTVLFTTGVVNMPSTLPRRAAGGQPNGCELVDVFTQLDITGSVNKSAIDPWIEDSHRLRRLTVPFNEVALPEQGRSASEFFASGTSASDIPGLGSPLRSKSILRIDLPVMFETALDPSTASLYYYNGGTNGLTLIGGVTRQPAASVLTMAGDAQLFSPFGHPLASGCYGSTNDSTPVPLSLSPFKITAPQLGVSVSQSVIESALQIQQTGSVTLSSSFDPSANGVIPISLSSFIDRPFLVEKAVIEVPLLAGASWLNDRTRTALDVVPGGGDPVDGTIEFCSDVGGPCITVTLLNCFASGRREIILSGTIVPAGDVVTGSVFRYFTTASIPGLKTVYEHTLEGFPCYGGTPSAIVTANVDGSFTGTVTVATDARSMNGCLIGMTGKGYYTTISDAASYAASEVGKDVIDVGAPGQTAYFLQAIDPYGRSMSGFDVSGRSVFGREIVPLVYATGTIMGITNPFKQVRTQALAQLAASHMFTGSYGILPNAGTFVGSSAPCPYLLLPSDKIVVGFAKHRPVRDVASRSMAMTFAELYAASNAGVLTGSHDVQIGTGSIRLTLYGSTLAENREKPSVHAQRVCTIDASEVYCNETILDQFELHARSDLTGSVFDGYMTGTMVATARQAGIPGNSLVTGRRERAFSISSARAFGAGVLSNGSVTNKLVPAWELAGDNRNVQCTSPTERYYDSLMPAIDRILRIDGSRPVAWSDPFLNALGNITSSWIFLNASSQCGDGSALLGSITGSANNDAWTFAYPFEPRYATAPRQTNIVRSLVARSLWNGDTLTTIAPQVFDRITVAVGRYSYSDGGSESMTIIPVCDFVSGVDNRMMRTAPDSDVIRALYGYGDNNLRTYLSGTTTGSTGATHFVSLRQSLSVAHDHYTFLPSVGPIMRGWKYGIVNGLPQYARALWRRGRFGQFRDMLEQRMDTKYFIELQNTDRGAPTVTAGPVAIKFLDQTGKLTKPENTWSHNLSAEATSSLPFFDGEQRNRPEPVAAALNMGIVDLTADAFGNIML